MARNRRISCQFLTTYDGNAQTKDKLSQRHGMLPYPNPMQVIKMRGRFILIMLITFCRYSRNNVVVQYSTRGSCPARVLVSSAEPVKPPFGKVLGR